MMRHAILISFIILLFAGLGCSGKGHGPAVPDLDIQGCAQSVVAGNTHFWGIWDVVLNPVSKTADIVPFRGIQFTCNVTRFLQPPGSATHLMGIQIDPMSNFTTGHVIVDVSFRHPFPGLDTYTGFDVRGVCIGNGSISGIVDTEVKYAGDNDLRVLNADGLTRWFNPSEFIEYGTLFGYTRGKLGTPSDTWTATLNGYKYFCNGLSKEADAASFFANPGCANPRGYFSAGAQLIRRYDLQFPVQGGSPVYHFQYAVVASWMAPVVQPPTQIPDDFPISAGCNEAFAFSSADQSDMYYVNSSNKGGALKMLVRVFDHQGAASQVEAIHLETPDGLINSNFASFTGASLNAAIVTQDSMSVTYLLQVASVTPYKTGDYPVLVVIENANPNSYDSGFPGVSFPVNAKLAAYFISSVHVGDQAPGTIQVIVPNGGEVWCSGVPYNITWTSANIAGNVKIEFSRDGGLSWPTIITADTANDSSEGWVPQVGDVTDKARVKVSSLANPIIFDITDSDFRIVNLGSGWVRAWGGPNEDRAWRCITDSQNNVYISGYFANTVDFDPGPDTYNQTALSARYVFLSKFDVSGNFVWAKTWGSPANGMEGGFGLCIDSYDNIYVTGDFFGTVDFDPNAGVVNRTATGNYDAYVSKLDSSGNLLWVKTWGGADGDRGTGVALDNSGNVYVCGWYRGTNVNFNPGGTPNLHSSDWVDPFLVKFDSNGNFIWAKTWGQKPLPSTIHPDYAQGVAVYGSSVYVSGDFGGTVNFDPGAGTQNRTSNGGRDMFLLRLDLSGNYQWVGTWGGSIASTQFEFGGAVDVDGAGNVYCTGMFDGTNGPVDFDPGPGTYAPANPIMGTYLSKFDPSNNFVWAGTWSARNYDQGKTNILSVDSQGNACVTGTFITSNGPVDFDPGPGNETKSAIGWCDGYLSKFNTNGDFQWVRTWGGGTSSASAVGHGVYAADSGLIYATGFFGLTVDFNPDPILQENRYGTNGDAYIIKFLPTGMW